MKCGAQLTPMNNSAHPRGESVLAHWPICTMKLVGGLTPENLAARNAIVEEEENWPAELEVSNSVHLGSVMLMSFLQRRKQERIDAADAEKAAREAARQERLRLNPPKRASQYMSIDGSLTLLLSERAESLRPAYTARTPCPRSYNQWRALRVSAISVET